VRREPPSGVGDQRARRYPGPSRPHNLSRQNVPDNPVETAGRGHALPPLTFSVTPPGSGPTARTQPQNGFFGRMITALRLSIGAFHGLAGMEYGRRRFPPAALFRNPFLRRHPHSSPRQPPRPPTPASTHSPTVDSVQPSSRSRSGNEAPPRDFAAPPRGPFDVSRHRPRHHEVFLQPSWG